MILIVFNHANACASMRSLVEIHNTQVTEYGALTPILFFVQVTGNGNALIAILFFVHRSPEMVL